MVFMLVLLVSYILQKTIRKDVSVSKDLESDNGNFLYFKFIYYIKKIP